MSEILITPDGQIDGAEYFSLCTAFFKNTPSCDVDLYMRNSNLAVDTSAKNAAYYTIDKPVKINWLEKRGVQTGEKPAVIYKN